MLAKVNAFQRQVIDWVYGRCGLLYLELKGEGTPEPVVQTLAGQPAQKDRADAFRRVFCFLSAKDILVISNNVRKFSM
jgi:hypothetical protein